jgi:hypothetical protein
MYWLVIGVLRVVMRGRDAVDGRLARMLFAGHYLILTVWSGVMFVGLAVAMLVLVQRDGWRALFCADASSGNDRGALHFWLCAS